MRDRHRLKGSRSGVEIVEEAVDCGLNFGDELKDAALAAAPCEACEEARDSARTFAPVATARRIEPGQDVAHAGARGKPNRTLQLRRQEGPDRYAPSGLRIRVRALDK
jgi:hypothetical protein